MKGEKVICRVCKIVELDGNEEIEFVKQYIKDKLIECFPERFKEVDWNSEDLVMYVDMMVEEYEKNVNDAIRRGFSKEASKIIGLLTVDRAIEIAKEKHISFLNKGHYIGWMF